MASKGPEAFRTISEVAEELDLPQHVLRFWETRFAHIRPMKRGGGRRYYRPDDIDLLRGIRALLYGEGYTIRGVQRILKEQGPRYVIGASRGDMSGLSRAQPEDDADEDDFGIAEPADEGVDDAGDALTSDDGVERQIEPTFDPREFRPRPSPPASDRSPALPAGALSADDFRRLQSTISDLLDLKRLLDQARH